MRLFNDGNNVNRNLEKKAIKEKKAAQKAEKKARRYEKKKVSEVTDYIHDSETFETNSISIGTCSIIGTRKEQQDSFSVNQNSKDDWAITVVCDGMGGLSGGKIASAAAADFMIAEATSFVRMDDLNKNVKLLDEKNDVFADQFISSVKKANEMVIKLKDKNGESMKAGTTMTMAVIKDKMLHWVSIGDSKMYFLRDDELKCLTHEHNYAFYADHLETDANFKFNPKEREDALVSYLGVSEIRCIDYNRKALKLKDNDRILLCSDGLYKLLSDEEIRAILMSRKTPQEIASLLIAESVQQAKKSQDNTTVIVIEYKEK